MITKAHINIDGYPYRMDLPDDRIIEKMNKQLNGKLHKVFYGKELEANVYGNVFVNFHHVRLNQRLDQPLMASAGTGRPFSNFTSTVPHGDRETDSFYFPLLIPLDKNGEAQPLNDQDWNTVKGGTLYQGGQPIFPGSLKAGSPLGDQPVTIGNTVTGYELEWYIVDGFLLCTKHACRCAAKALWVAGIGGCFYREVPHA